MKTWRWKRPNTSHSKFWNCSALSIFLFPLGVFLSKQSAVRKESAFKWFSRTALKRLVCFSYLAYIATYIDVSSEFFPTISIYPLLQRKQNQMPCGTLALQTQRPQGWKEVAVLIFPLPFCCCRCYLLVAITSTDPVGCCILPGPMGNPDKSQCFHKEYLPGMYRNYGQSQPHSSSFPNTGAEGKELPKNTSEGGRCSSWPGDPRLLWEQA